MGSGTPRGPITASAHQVTTGAGDGQDPKEPDPGPRAQRCPAPGETEAQGELQMSPRTRQLTQLIAREEAEAAVEPFLETGEVRQCRGRASAASPPPP